MGGRRHASIPQVEMNTIPAPSSSHLHAVQPHPGSRWRGRLAIPGFMIGWPAALLDAREFHMDPAGHVRAPCAGSAWRRTYGRVEPNMLALGLRVDASQRQTGQTTTALGAQA